MHPTPLATRAALAAASLLAPLASQVTFAEGELTRIRLSSASPNVALTQAVTGHFTGMHLRDAIVLADTTPLLVTAPGVLRSAVRLPAVTQGPTFGRTGVRAIATVSGIRRDGLDALAVVTDTGLWLWYKVPNYGSRVAHYHATQLSSLPEWAGVTRLRTGDIDGDGDTDILGLQADNTTLRCMEVKFVGEDLPWSQWTLPTYGPVHDFQIADVITGGQPEIVVLNGVVPPPPNGQASPPYQFDGGLRLFAPINSPLNTVPLQSRIAPNTGGALVVRTDGSGTRVFLAARVAGVNSLSVFVGGPAGLDATAGATRNLPGEATAMAVSPWRRAIDVDAVVTLKNQPNPVVVRCHWLNGAWNLSAPTVVPVTSLAAPVGYENRATPLIADFHGDPAAPPERQGRPRLLYPVENLGVGQPGAIAMQNEMDTERVGFVRFEGGGAVGAVLGVPTTGLQPTRIAMVSWAVEPVAPGSAVLKAGVDLLAASAMPLAFESGTNKFTSALDTAGDLYPTPTWQPIWQFVVRFECDHNGSIIRWPARTLLASSEQGTRLMEDSLRAIYGANLDLPIGRSLILSGGGCFCGITGDTTAPPCGDDSDDDNDEPPQGGGG